MAFPIEAVAMYGGSTGASAGIEPEDVRHFQTASGLLARLQRKDLPEPGPKPRLRPRRSKENLGGSAHGVLTRSQVKDASIVDECNLERGLCTRHLLKMVNSIASQKLSCSHPLATLWLQFQDSPGFLAASNNQFL